MMNCFTSSLAISSLRRYLKKGEILQLERKGYFIVDKPYYRAGTPMAGAYIRPLLSST
jgi:hypothetical protein